MKLKKREIVIVSILFFIVLFGIFWLSLLDPIQKQLSGNQLELQNLQKQDQENQAIIDSVSVLQTTKSKLEEDITSIEQSLLPVLKSEVITEHILSILDETGLEYVTDISALQPPESINTVTRPDGSKSDITTNSLELKITLSGTDGVTDGGIPYIGYDQFIRAVKVIEKELPKAMRITDISMTDTRTGFQFFSITVKVYAFNIPNPVSDYDESQKYINWYRPDAPLGGLIGIPYAMCENIPAIYRPFASYNMASGVDIFPNAENVPEETTPAETEAQ